jgi:uncharacterized protein YukE
VVGWLVDEVVPGSPAAFFGLAAGFSEVALTASEVLSDLNLIRGQVDSSIWRGDAAEAFVDEIGKLPSQLEKLHSSYSSASLCMRAYGTSLADLRLRAAVACRAGVEAESAESSAQGARAGAVAADSHLRAAALPDAPPVPAADFSGHDSAIVAARGRIAAAREELRRVGDERKSAEAVCVGALRDASAEGIRNDSWWRHALVATLKFVGSVCRVVAIVLLVIAVVIIIVVMVGSGLGLLAGFLAGLAMASTVLAVATALQAIALATDAGLKTMGESDRSWTSMGIEALLLALPLVGSKASPFLSKLALGERLVARSTVAARVSAKFAKAGGEAAEYMAKRALSKTAAGVDDVAGGVDDVAGGVDDVAGVGDDVAGGVDDVLRSQGDPMLEIQGPGRGSPEFDGLVADLEAAGFEVEIRTGGTLAYSPSSGQPGKIILNPDASMSALSHEALHASDDAANGFPGMGFYIQNPGARWSMEYNAYLQEIRVARLLGRYDIARRLLANARAERLSLLGY